jgi:hypothetical protein
MLDLAHVRKAKARNALHDLALKLVVSQRFILARRADFSTLDPLAAENGLSLYRRVRSVELVEGTVAPIALAVLRLIASSNFAGCSTGRSAGFVPRKRLAANRAVIERWAVAGKATFLRPFWPLRHGRHALRGDPVHNKLMIAVEHRGRKNIQGRGARCMCLIDSRCYFLASGDTIN